MFQRMLAIWSLVPLPFLKPAWTFGSSWSLTVEAWFGEFLALLCYHVGWVQLCSSLNILWPCLSLRLEWKRTFPVLWPLLSFQICWHVECSTFTPSSFRIWNSSAKTPSPPLALLHIAGCLALGEWSHHCGYLGHEDLLVYISSVYSCHLFLLSSASVRSIPFLSFIVPILHECFPWYL